jgi:hypothetical protein
MGRCKFQSVLENQLTENKIVIPHDSDGWERQTP